MLAAAPAAAEIRPTSTNHESHLHLPACTGVYAFFLCTRFNASAFPNYF